MKCWWIMPMPARMASPGEWKTCGCAVDQDLALVRLVHAVELAHQRAFAGAVLAQQGVHFAGVHIKIDMVVRQHARKALDDIAHFHVLDARWEWRTAMQIAGKKRRIQLASD